MGLPDRAPRAPAPTAPPWPRRARRSRSPTAGTRPARRCRSTGRAATASTTSRTTSAGARARARHGRREDLHRRDDDGAGRPPRRVVQGLSGRPFLLHQRRRQRRLRGPRRARAPRRRAAVDRRRGRPGVQRLRRDRAGQLPAGQDLRQHGLRQPGPEGADRLRRAPGRPRAADGARRRAAPARPEGRQHEGHRHARRLHEQRGRPLRPGDRQRLRRQPLGLPVLLAQDRRRRQAVRRLDEDDHDAAERLGAADRAVAERVGPVRRLLPALALQARRGRGRRASGPRQRAADSARLQQPRRVLPRRRRHRLRLPQQPVAGHGRRHAVRRRQLRRLLAPQRHEDRRDADACARRPPSRSASTARRPRSSRPTRRRRRSSRRSRRSRTSTRAT